MNLGLGSDVGAVADAAGAGLKLTTTILTQNDRDTLEKRRGARNNEIQDAMASGDPDRLWNIGVQVAAGAGYPPTPTPPGGDGAVPKPRLLGISYELLHSLLLGCAKAEYLESYLARVGETNLSRPQPVS